MSDSRLRLVKIVRDNVGQFLGTTEVVYEGAVMVDVIEGLKKKLVEEAVEYVVNPSIGELADILEVVAGLAHYELGLGEGGFGEVMAEMVSKREERGAFKKGIGMFVYTTAPSRHEGEHAKSNDQGVE